MWNLAQADQRVPEPQPGDRREVRVRVQAGDPRRLPERGGCGLEVAGLVVSEGRRHEQIAVDERVAAGLVRMARRARQPAAAADWLAAGQQPEPDPEGAASGAVDVADSRSASA